MASLLFALASAWRLVSLALPSLHSLVRACHDVAFSDETVISLIVLTLTGMCLSVLVLGIRSGIRHYRAQQVTLSTLRVQYRARYRGIGLTVFTHDRPEAFSAGLLRPRLYLSSATLHTLDTAELAAVIEHEFHHCRRRDPLRLLAVQLLSDSLFFLPVMGRLRERYRTLAELAADEAAVTRGACPGTLAAALLAFTEGTRPGVVGIAPERVDHLLGNRTHWNVPIAPLAVTLTTLAGLFAIATAFMLAVAPSGFGLAGFSAQLCMVVMAVAPGSCANPMDVLPFLLGVCLVAIARYRWRPSRPR